MCTSDDLADCSVRSNCYGVGSLLRSTSFLCIVQYGVLIILNDFVKQFLVESRLTRRRYNDFDQLAITQSVNLISIY